MTALCKDARGAERTGWAWGGLQDGWEGDKIPLTATQSEVTYVHPMPGAVHTVLPTEDLRPRNESRVSPSLSV